MFDFYGDIRMISKEGDEGHEFETWHTIPVVSDFRHRNVSVHLLTAIQVAYYIAWLMFDKDLS